MLQEAEEKMMCFLETYLLWLFKFKIPCRLVMDREPMLVSYIYIRHFFHRDNILSIILNDANQLYGDSHSSNIPLRTR